LNNITDKLYEIDKIKNGSINDKKIIRKTTNDLYTEKAKKIIKEISNKFKKNSKTIAIFLIGSYAKGNQNSKSDIDLYIVQKNIRDNVEFFYYKNFPIQIQFRNLNSFKKKIKKRTRSEPIGSYAKIIYIKKENSKEINYYLSISNKLKELGPIKVSDGEKKQILICLSNDVDSITGYIEKKDFVSAKVQIIQILIKALNIFYDSKCYFWPGEKHLFQDLEEKDKDLYKAVSQAICGSDIIDSFSKGKQICEKILEESGVVIKSYKIYFD